MGKEEDNSCRCIGEVRTDNFENNGKLLFELMVVKEEPSILIKPRGDKHSYSIPLYRLIEMFMNSTKEERMKLYIKGIEKKTKQ